MADYGVPLMVVIWSAVGYAVNRGTPSGVPRRTRLPNTWDEKTNWTVARVGIFIHVNACASHSLDLKILPDWCVCPKLQQHDVMLCCNDQLMYLLPSAENLFELM